MSDANTSYINKNYSTLKDDVDIALKTGYDNGNCYYFYGVYYEYCNDFVTAKKMYKIAKKKQYLPAKDALKELKKKTNN